MSFCRLCHAETVAATGRKYMQKPDLAQMSFDMLRKYLIFSYIYVMPAP